MNDVKRYYGRLSIIEGQYKFVPSPDQPGKNNERLYPVALSFSYICGVLQQHPRKTLGEGSPVVLAVSGTKPLELRANF